MRRTMPAAWRSARLRNSSTAATPTWTVLANAPHIGCLHLDSAGTVWACTQNYASPQLNLPSDGFGIMKSDDLLTWTGVLKYEDIQAPVACAAARSKKTNACSAIWICSRPGAASSCSSVSPRQRWTALARCRALALRLWMVRRMLERAWLLRPRTVAAVPLMVGHRYC